MHVLDILRMKICEYKDYINVRYVFYILIISL